MSRMPLPSDRPQWVMLSLALVLASLGWMGARVGGQGPVSYLGQWKGIITQDLGPSVRYFDMEMSVAPTPDDKDFFNISCHVMDGDYHAYMSGTARVLPNGELFVKEDEIVRADSIPGMAWCLKRLELRKSMEKGVLHLRGRWTGDTYFGACPPGKMDLIRPVTRT